MFLLATSVGAIFTLNALRPAKRWWPLVGPGFFASWLTGELAPHHLFWQLIATGLFVWAGALQGWVGYAALGLVALSWVGLARLIVESARTKQVMISALREGLGVHFKDKISGDLRLELRDRWGVRQRLLPLPVWDSRVEVIRNIIYREVDGVRLRLDIYRPRAKKGPFPTVLHVHGGAWMVGSKDDQGKPLAYRLAAHGWLVVSANYRLSPRFAWPAHIIDVKAAVAWIKTRGIEYGVDPSFVAITGGSAGGHLSALAALTPNDPEWQPGFESADTTLHACVPFYGVYDFCDRKGIWKGTLLRRMLERGIVKKRRAEAPDVFNKASPMSRIGQHAPPFFVIHGTRDSLVPVAEARLFVELMRQTSKQPVLYAELPGAQHAFEVFPSRRTEHALVGVETFLTWALSARVRACSKV
ncbi:MAG: alpha/beta hydrolase [Polyangiaceae bacterium]|nr:alpha/beta hydrolase [Polyangiaceae bacterium]